MSQENLPNDYLQGVACQPETAGRTCASFLTGQEVLLSSQSHDRLASAGSETPADEPTPTPMLDSYFDTYTAATPNHNKDPIPRTSNRNTDRALKAIRGQFGKIIEHYVENNLNLQCEPVSKVIDIVLPSGFAPEGRKRRRSRNIETFKQRISTLNPDPKISTERVSLEQVLYTYGSYHSIMAAALENDPETPAVLRETANWCVRQYIRRQIGRKPVASRV